MFLTLCVALTSTIEYVFYSLSSSQIATALGRDAAPVEPNDNYGFQSVFTKPAAASQLWGQKVLALRPSEGLTASKGGGSPAR